MGRETHENRRSVGTPPSSGQSGQVGSGAGRRLRLPDSDGSPKQPHPDANGSPRFPWRNCPEPRKVYEVQYLAGGLRRRGLSTAAQWSAIAIRQVQARATGLSVERPLSATEEHIVSDRGCWAR